MARVRAASSPALSRPNEDLALLPVGALVCAGCNRRPETCVWSEYQDNQPTQELCEDCWHGYCKGVAPRDPQSKPVVASMLKTNPVSCNRVQKWKVQLENRGALSPAIGTSNPQSVFRKVTVGMEWMEERRIHPIEKLKGAHPNVDWENPPCCVCTVNDASKQPQQVVLTQMPASEPVLRVYCKTEVQMDEHFVSPDTMLRVGQGDEFFRQQLTMMTRMVPFSQCDSESVLQEKLRKNGSPGVHSGDPVDMEVDPLLAPEKGGAVSFASEVVQHGSSTAGSSAAGSSGGGGEGVGLGGAVSPADAGSGRRLRPNLSNPEPPITPCKKARGRDDATSDTRTEAAGKEEEQGRGRGRGRGRGPKPGRKMANDASPGKLTKANAIPLTLENVLGGKVSQPRVQLGWRRAEKPKSHKCDMHNETKELQQLAAAITLLPDELGQQTEDEILASAACVEEKLARNRWPWYTWQSLLNRRLQSMLAAQQWTSFLHSVWEWGKASETETLDVLEPTLRSITAALGNNADDTFPQSGEARAKIVRDWLVKDALADMMSKNEEGSAGILALHDLVQGLPQPTEEATTLERATFDEALGAVAAVAGLVQDAPAAMNQLDALRLLISEGAQSESALALRSLFETAYWQVLLQNFWEFAVEEVMIGPQMLEVIEGLKSSSPEVVDEMWRTTMHSYTQWSTKQRPGRTAALSRALAHWCGQSAESLCSGEASEAWLLLAEQIRSRSKWVEENCATKIGDSLAKLDQMYNANHSKVQVSVVIGLMSQWSPGVTASDDSGDADSLAAVADEGHDKVQGILTKLDACNGLMLTEKDVPVATQFLKQLAGNVNNEKHARLGLRVTEMLPILDANSREAQSDRSAWEHAICGWELAALASGGAVSPADESKLVSLAAKWEKGIHEHSDFTQHPQLQEAVRTAITSGRVLFADLVGKRKNSMQDAVSKLELCAGGKDDKGSWKSNLKDDSTWDDVQREAKYFLQRKPEEGPLHKHLDKVFEELHSARTNVEAATTGLKIMHRLGSAEEAGGADSPAEAVQVEELSKKAKRVETQARITHTESFFFKLLTGTSKERATKIHSRITEMATHGVSTSSLQPLLWRKALAVSTARK